jgi:H+-translocating NAD(P) transhydrogenase subunit alpha
VKVGVPKETVDGERRVALVPEVARHLTGMGLEVIVEPGAGQAALIPDAAYEEAGATMAGDPWSADVVLKVQPPSAEEIGRLGSDSVLIGFLQPLTAPDTARALAQAGVTSFAMEAIPRISRAQSMDALSSQASVAGYRAVLIAAQDMGRFFPMLTTAAGTIPPAKVLVLGAGVAGLQALATARRLGAVTTGYDVRPEVGEQVKSLGAKFLDLGVEASGEGGYARELTDEEKAKQQEALAEAIGRSDVVITTALVPGRPAPKLITADAVKRMAAGSVIIDLAAEAGGNCELTEPGETVVKEDVIVAGPLNVPSSMPEHASRLYAKNMQAVLELIVTDGELTLDFDDEVVAGACLTRGGEIVNERAKQAASAPAA